MAKESPPSTTTSKPPPRLPRLSNDHRISKRPLLHPPIARPKTSSHTPKMIYISSSSPFISVIKRARVMLSEIEKRISPTVDFNQHPNRVLADIEAGVKARDGKGAGRSEEGNATGKPAEEVVLKATGKAIEKGLRIAMWWMSQGDVRVTIRTSSVAAIDDVVERNGVEGEGGDVEIESRVRRTSCLEVGLSLR